MHRVYRPIDECITTGTEAHQKVYIFLFYLPLLNRGNNYFGQNTSTQTLFPLHLYVNHSELYGPYFALYLHKVILSSFQ